MACLVLDFEGLDVLTHELIGDTVTIGSAPSNDIVIDHPTVSAQHARLTKSPIGYRIKDLESTNGTQINGVSISDAQLKNGAEIRFGYITGFFRDAVASKLQLPGEHNRPNQIRVPETQSTFHPHAQRNAFHRRDARQQSRAFARARPQLQHSPKSNRLYSVCPPGAPSTSC
jgi:pSer/pThr/pTyr-binding forkhead associated (FHA) protein